MSDFLSRLIRIRLLWALSGALALAGTAGAVAGWLDPTDGLVASTPFIVLAFRYIDEKREESAASLADPTHAPVGNDQPSGDLSLGPGTGT
jgi:hypothetical protein